MDSVHLTRARLLEWKLVAVATKTIAAQKFSLAQRFDLIHLHLLAHEDNNLLTQTYNYDLAVVT